MGGWVGWMMGWEIGPWGTRIPTPIFRRGKEDVTMWKSYRWPRKRESESRRQA